MTCKEKLREMHPEFTERTLMEMYDITCPSAYGIMSDPVNKDTGRDDCAFFSCQSCWDREVPDASNVGVTDSHSGHPDPVGEPGEPGVKRCDTCDHAVVCKHRDDFIKITKTFENGYDSCCSIDDIGRVTSDYLELTISCKHYKKAEVASDGI